MSEVAFPKLQRSSPLGERAYDAIKSLIVAGDLAPGQLVAESQLAARLGISRSPVREALARLQEESFVEVEPWKRARIAPLTPESIQDLYSVRTALESR